MSAAFLMVMFMAFGGMPQLAVTLQNRVVWFKHRDMNMYNATSFAWSSALVQLPLSLAEAFIFIILVYFMVGFTTGAHSRIISDACFCFDVAQIRSSVCGPEGWYGGSAVACARVRHDQGSAHAKRRFRACRSACALLSAPLRPLSLLRSRASTR